MEIEITDDLRLRGFIFLTPLQSEVVIGILQRERGIDIAKRLGISKQHVNNLRNDVLNKLKKGYFKIEVMEPDTDA